MYIAISRCSHTAVATATISSKGMQSKCSYVCTGLYIKPCLKLCTNDHKATDMYLAPLVDSKKHVVHVLFCHIQNKYIVKFVEPKQQ